MTTIRISEKQENNILFFDMISETLMIKVTNLGCHVLSIFAPDNNGQMDDVVLGLENITDCFHDGSYMGAVVGRVANRIGGASFTLNGKQYKLAANNGKNHLHGGNIGFDQKIFSYDILDDGIRFFYQSVDGEEGYPGTLDLTVTYRLHGNTFSIEYEAVSDQDTLANFTNHMYFNLSGNTEKVTGHWLKIASEKIACVDKTCLATGEYLPVDNTPFDFREFHLIGERINEEYEQLKNAGGYDHPFLLEQQESSIMLWHKQSGRKLTIDTTMPTAQIYTGNFLSGGYNGKNGTPYENRDGVAIETQFLPNSIHIEKEPRVILRKGQKQYSKTSYRFMTE